MYWQRVDPEVAASDRAALAFDQRWFGAKSLGRVRYLISSFVPRYDSFPHALGVLRSWSSMSVATRQTICHWHLQLSDPLYRRFTGEFLLERRSLLEPKVSRDAVLRWVKGQFPGRWAESTCVQFASKLLSASCEAGLVTRRDPRSLLLPKVSDHALAYLMYLLRETRFEGTLTANPYLASVGLGHDAALERCRELPGLRVRRMMGLVEFDWAYPDLMAWAKEVAL